jgi:hypothetical protein
LSPPAPRSRREPRPEMVPTTIKLPVALKRAAQKLAIDLGVDLQDLIADGLRLVLAQRKGGA